MDCPSTVKPVAGARLEDGSLMRETASKREACEEEPLDILRKVRQATENCNQQRGRNYPSSAEPHERTKGQINVIFNMTSWRFHKQESHVGFVEASWLDVSIAVSP